MCKIIEKLKEEAARIEEDSLFSGKRHHNAASRWDRYNLWLGLPSVIICSLASVTAFADYPIAAGIIGAVAAVLAAITTFLKPSKRASSHASSGSSYLTLKNEARMFREIECIGVNNHEVLKKRLLEFSERRNRLNEQASSTSSRDYENAKEGIEGGEQEYQVDHSN